MTITITRVFDDYAPAQAAVQSIRNLGVADSDISIVTPDASTSDPNRTTDGDMTATATGAGIGSMVGGGAGLLAGLGLMAVPGIGPLVAAGWLAASAAGVVAGAATGAAAGGLVDVLGAAGYNEDEAHSYAEAVRRGGVLVSVRTTDDMEDRVSATLDQHDPADLAMRRQAWEQEGWTGYDSQMPSYTEQQRREERSRYM